VRGIGTRQCYVPLEWRPAAGIQDGKVPQQKLDRPSAGTSTQARWSPSAITIDAQLLAPAVLIVNQNYESGWRASTGTVGSYIFGEQRQWTPPPGGVAGTPPSGMLSVSLPAGTHHVVLRHHPPGLGLGIVFMVFGIAAA